MNNFDNKIIARVPPQALAMEQAVLGAIILERDALSKALRIIRSAECFYLDTHQLVFTACQALDAKGSPVDLLTVTEELRRAGNLEQIGGAYFIMNLTMSVVSGAHVEAHARIIVEKWMSRELIRISVLTTTAAYEDSEDIFDQVERTEIQLLKITEQVRTGNIKSIGAALPQTLHEMREAQCRPDGMTGLPTGLRKLDEITKGLQNGNMIVVAGGTGEGKTTLALNICEQIAEKTGPAGFISLEMRDRELIWKVISKRIREDVNSVMSGNFSVSKWEQLERDTFNQLHKLPLYFYDAGGLDIVELKSVARTMVQKHGIKVLAVDYIQLVRGVPGKRYGTREQEVNDVSKELKALAMELNIPVIALSQLNRLEKTNSKRMYVLSDLRESGAIEQDANYVWFVYRPIVHKLEAFEGAPVTEMDAWINIAKSRLGTTGMIRVTFDGPFNKFSDYEVPDFVPLSFSPGIISSERQIIDYTVPRAEQMAIEMADDEVEF